MNAFSRRGACPALSAPMQTGDGLLVRLNPVAEGIVPNILIGLCESAARHGNGIVEVTARGSIQIRGLTASSARALAAAVDTLGIDVRTGVPVETGPLAGIDPGEIADPRPLADTIRAAMAAAGLSARLGPKVSVVVDGGGWLMLDDVLADVRMVAVREDGKTFWHLSIGGTAATARPVGKFAESEAVATTLQILHAVAELGFEARARDIRSLACGSQKPALPPHPAASRPPSPRWGEEESPVTERFLSPWGEGGRAQRRPGEGDVGLPHQVITHKASVSLPIGILPLAGSTCALLIALPFGSLPAATLIDLARKASDLGATEIRPAPKRSLIVLGLFRTDCDILLAEAARLGFVTDPADPRLSISACPGAPSCAAGKLATRDLATEIAKAEPEFFDRSFTLHISGCAKGCAHPAAAALTLVGGEDGAGLVVDETAKHLPAGYTPRYEAVRGLDRLARLVLARREPAETISACLARLGVQTIAAAFTQDRA